MKLALKHLNEIYTDFHVSFTIVRGARSYDIEHIPSGKKSACIIGNKLESVERIIKNCIERPHDHTNPLNCNSYFR